MGSSFSHIGAGADGEEALREALGYVVSRGHVVTKRATSRNPPQTFFFIDRAWWAVRIDVDEAAARPFRASFVWFARDAEGLARHSAAPSITDWKW